MPGRFRFKGTAIGAGGHVSVPFNDVIEVQAVSALPEIGGYGSARSVDFSFRGILRFDLAYSEVVGSTCNDDDRNPVLSTRVNATVEGLNIMDMVTADRIVSHLVSTFKGEGPGEPSVLFLGSHFENLRVAGIPVKVTLAVDVLDKYNTYKSLREAYGHEDSVRDLFGDAAFKERIHEAPAKVAQWFSHAAAAQPEMPANNGISRVSLVRRLEPDRIAAQRRLHTISQRPDGNNKASIMAFSDTRAASEESALYGNPDEIARKLEKLRDMGVEYVLLNGGGTSRDNLRRFAKEVMPAFRTEPEMRAAG